MTRDEIIELFIRGAEIDRRLPDTARPKQLKAQALPYVHDHIDMAGWGGERYAEERQAFWDSRSTRLKTSDIDAWEMCNTLVALVDNESERRCLWHWSMSKAGGRPFRRWCKAEGIHVETGRRRKDRAIAHIELSFLRNPLQNNENASEAMLRCGPEISDKHVILDEPIKQHTWRDDGAFSPIGLPELRDFSWADKRNELRRQRDAKKRQQAA